MLSEAELQFLKTRRRLVRIWPILGTCLGIAVIAVMGWLYKKTPLLINPALVSEKLEKDLLLESTCQLMAEMMPLMAVLCFLLMLVMICFGFFAYRHERRYLSIIDAHLTGRALTEEAPEDS